MLSVAPPLWNAKMALYDAIRGSNNVLNTPGIKQAEDIYQFAMKNSTVADRADVRLRDIEYRERERQNHLKAMEVEKIRTEEESRQIGFSRKRRAE